MMQIKLDTKPYAEVEVDALVAYLFDDSEPIQGPLDEIDRGPAGLLARLPRSGERAGRRAGGW